jgi:tetratricopeptide (TPR) repeat protein
MKKKNLLHIIAVTGLVTFIVLGVASGATSMPSVYKDGQQQQKMSYTGEDYVKSAITQIENKNYDLAIDDCNYAIRMNRDNYEALFYRGVASAGKGDYDFAIKNYTWTIELSPPILARVYNQRALTYVYYMKTNYDQAIADATQAIRFSPNSANYYGTRGWAYFGKGDYDKASDDFYSALRMDPNNESSKEGLSKIQEAQLEEDIDWSQFE